MSKIVKCKACGNDVAKSAKTCPHCGAKVKKSKIPIWGKVLIVLLVFGLIGSCSNKTKKENISTMNENEIESSDLETSEENAGDDLETKDVVDTSLDTSDYLKICPEVLFDYGNYMGGQQVVTAFEVASRDAGMLKVKTDNNDGYFFSIVCNFEDKEIPKQFEEGDKVTVAGTMRETDPDSFLSTPTATMDNCTIIGRGEIIQELADGMAEQEQLGKQFKQEYEDRIAAEAKAEKDAYISQCETVSYSDVERNPDSYDGKLIKISGKVEQVSEGWFDSVTLRVNCSGNMWYVTYTRSEGESRILEGDSITGYGECDGVQSYTTVIGSQVTIPSMKMKYYD